MPRTDYEILSVHLTCKRVKIKYINPDGERKDISTKFQQIKPLKEYVDEGLDLAKAIVRDFEEGE